MKVALLNNLVIQLVSDRETLSQRITQTLHNS